MKDGLYHKEIGFPKELTVSPVFGLTASVHALNRAQELNVPTVPKNFLPRNAEVIEIEVSEGKAKKILARESLDKFRDLCYVFLTDTKLIKTVWINMVDDKHATLDRSRFVRP